MNHLDAADSLRTPIVRTQRELLAWGYRLLHAA